MKKLFSIILVGTMCVGLLGGCGAEYISQNKALKEENEELKNQIRLMGGTAQSSEEVQGEQQEQQQEQQQQEPQEKIYAQGEVWSVDGEFNFTINSVTRTQDRNEFSDKTPAEVVIIDYSYENLGYTNEIQDLYISSSQMQVIDGAGEVADTYPVSTKGSPKPTPVGAKCANVQQALGLNNASQTVKIIMTVRDSSRNTHKATFEIPIQ